METFAQIPRTEIALPEKISVAFKTTWKKTSGCIAAQQVDSITEEHHTLASLTHPNLLRLLGWFQLGDNSYLFFPFYPNSFSQTLYRGNHSAEQCLTWAHQVCDGLAVLHDANLLHLHLNPTTLILDNNHILLADVDCTLSHESDDTVETLPFHAPEKLLQQNPSPNIAWDIYSFGIFLYTCLTQTRPLAHLDYLSMMCFIREQKRPPLPENMTPKYAHLVKWCWEPEPQARPQTMAHIKRALPA